MMIVKKLMESPIMYLKINLIVKLQMIHQFLRV